MRTASKRPGCAAFEGQDELRLGERPRQNGQIALPGVTKQVFEGFRKTVRTDSLLVSLSLVNLGEIVVQCYRGGILPGIDVFDDTIFQNQRG